MLCRATQDGQVMVESSEKMWSTGEGNGKPLKYCQLQKKCWAGRSIAGIKIAGRNINNLRYVDDTTLMAESEEELKSLLMKEER